MTPLPYWIAPRAQRAMNNELARFPQTETGGLLLGYSDPAGGVRVWEATDGGYEKVLREESAFAYDPDYVRHLCAVLSGLYTPPLEVVGVWHKHNSPSSPVPFSRADEKIHRQLVRGYDHPCLSVLFERTEEEDIYEMRVFHLTEEGYRELCEAPGPEAPAREETCHE